MSEHVQICREGVGRNLFWYSQFDSITRVFGLTDFIHRTLHTRFQNLKSVNSKFCVLLGNILSQMYIMLGKPMRIRSWVKLQYTNDLNM
jgi:hypothetical protein